ncbi:hypothetical protein IKG45_01840 [Candidatus Saccharibacteria bacterium]|nr:hypothetical protein [Candidatus Saccharibacteria bacterium]
MGNNQTFTSRRGVNSETTSWARGRNFGKRKGTGRFSYYFVIAMLVLVVGLIYVAQGTKATGYDYQISEIEEQINELEIKKEDLAVEQARLTSLASASNNKVAVSMEDATPSGYAE